MFAKVYLEITNVCNMNCSFCVGTTRKKHFLTSDEFEYLASRIKPHTDFLYFHLMGEPTLHPLLEEFLFISEKLGFKVIITTNGTLLSSVGDVLLNCSALHKVSISLHSFEANNCIAEVDYFNECINFADLASQKGIITVFRLWNDGGENKLNGKILSFLHDRFGYDWSENDRGIRVRNKLFIEKGKKFDWPLHSETVTENITCYGMRDHIGVLCDGTVVPCCLDYDGNEPLGNLFENSLDEILSTPKAIKFKKMIESGKAPCEMCKRCGFVQKRFLHID